MLYKLTIKRSLLKPGYTIYSSAEYCVRNRDGNKTIIIQSASCPPWLWHYHKTWPLEQFVQIKKKKKNEEKLADEDGADQNYFMMLLTWDMQ